MKRSRLIAVLCVVALAFAACAKKSMDSADRPTASGPAGAIDETRAKEAEKAGVKQDRVAEPPADGRKVIRTGRIELVVGSYDDARKKLDALLERSGGYVDATEVHRSADAISDATIVVRIPRDAFGTVVPSLRDIGEVVSETTNANDVTDSYVDVSARLASDRQLEKRLLELATARDGKIDQVLAVEKELARVRGEIEGYEGRLRQWDNQVAMSTLTLSLVTKRPEIASEPTTFGDRSSSAFHGSVGALRDFGALLFFGFIALLPWLTILLPAALITRRVLRNRRTRVPTAVAQPIPPPATPAA